MNISLGIQLRSELWVPETRSNLERRPYDLRYQQCRAFKSRAAITESTWCKTTLLEFHIRPIMSPSRSPITTASRISSLSFSAAENKVSSSSSLPVDGSPLQSSSDLFGVRGDSVSDNAVGGEELTNESATLKRKFCSRCYKAEVLCICRHIETVVNNRTLITILQHPQERKHPLGTARIALLALKNVEVVSIPEIDQSYSCRIRGKVIGSKRFIANRGGKKNPTKVDDSNGNRNNGTHVKTPNSFDSFEEQDDLAPNDCRPMAWETVPPWINLRPGAGLLFPSHEAVDLVADRLDGSTCCGELSRGHTNGKSNSSMEGTETKVKSAPLSQLIVIDGTWSKARRIKYENPWLNSLPLYQLPSVHLSRYGGLRREPQEGFLSTIESIVYALQVLEPETRNLETLLDVFDEMMERHRIYREKKSNERILKSEGSKCV